MVNINLASAGYEKERQSSSYGKGTLVIFIVLVLLVIGYFAIVFMKGSASTKIEAANSQYAVERAKLINSNKDVVDFQNRIVTAKDLLAQKNSGYQSLPAVEKAIVQGGYLQKLEFDQAKNSVSLEGIVDNFDVLARQILSFKQSDYFSQVDEGTTKLDQNGKVNFTLNLKIK